MYKITIQHHMKDTPALKVNTESRNTARSVALLGKENNLKVEVMVESKPRVVKFKGVD